MLKRILLIKITLLLLLLILNAIFPDVMLLFPFFVGYCLPLKHKTGFKRYLNFSIVFLIIFSTIYIISNSLSSNSKIMFYPKVYNFVDFVFYLPLSIFLLLCLKYIYKYSISYLDVSIHIFGILIINYLAEPLANNIIIKENFSTFTMSLHLLFIFHSLYCIWKVDQALIEKTQ